MRTGVIRKLDEVGRVVIPKEIRNYLKLKEGSPLEIGISDNGDVVLRGKTSTYISPEIINDVIRHFADGINMNIVVSIGVNIMYGDDRYIGCNISVSARQIVSRDRVYFACTDDSTTILPLCDKISDVPSEIMVGVSSVDMCVIAYSNRPNVDISEVKVLEILAQILKGMIG